MKSAKKISVPWIAVEFSPFYFEGAIYRIISLLLNEFRNLTNDILRERLHEQYLLYIVVGG